MKARLSSSGQRLMSRMPQARSSVRVVTCLKCLGNSLHEGTSLK